MDETRLRDIVNALDASLIGSRMLLTGFDMRSDAQKRNPDTTETLFQCLQMVRRHIEYARAKLFAYAASANINLEEESNGRSDWQATLYDDNG